MPVPLCVTADDFGLAKSVNAAILRLARARHVDAVSVMAHPAARLDEAHEIATTGVATGLHLVLTEYPGAPVQRERTLFELAVGLATRPKSTLRSIREAIEYQVERYLRLGLRLDFINSHQYVHAMPPIWRRVAELAERENVSALRCAWGSVGCGWRRQLVAATFRAARSLSPVETRQLLCPLHVGGARPLEIRELEPLIARAASRLPLHAIAELVVHPGDCDSGLVAPRTWGDRRRMAEYDFVTSPEFSRIIESSAGMRGLKDRLAGT